MKIPCFIRCLYINIKYLLSLSWAYQVTQRRNSISFIRVLQECSQGFFHHSFCKILLSNLFFPVFASVEKFLCSARLSETQALSTQDRDLLLLLTEPILFLALILNFRDTSISIPNTFEFLWLNWLDYWLPPLIFSFSLSTQLNKNSQNTVDIFCLLFIFFSFSLSS